MRSYLLPLLASAVLLVGLGKAQTPGTKSSPQRNSAAKSNSGSTETPSAILASNGKAVAVIVAAGSDSAKLGTGFSIGNHGLLLTNFHVLDGATTVGVKLPGTGAPILTTKVRGYDLDDDLVILQVDGADSQPVMLGDSDKAFSGQPVVVVGNPEGLEQTVSNGLVSGIRELNGRRLLQISAPISAGSSGSPVFNDHGEVIGIVVSSIEAGQNLNFAVPINYAKPLLERRTEQAISSLPRGNRAGSEAEPSQGVDATAADPTLGETLKWLVEKVGTAGYKYCQWQIKNLMCQDTHYEFVEAGDCKLIFTSVSEISAAGREPFRHSGKLVLSLWSSSPDISVSASAFRCDKPCRNDFGDREIFFVGRPRIAGVYFASRDLADRVAKAMNHAIALCGKEPF
jgi:S1-C subfamily serine protease